MRGLDNAREARAAAAKEAADDVREACQERNEIDAGLRRFADSLDRRVSGLLTFLGTDPNIVEAFDLSASAMLPPAIETDEDCDGDGVPGDPGDFT